jgi:hypothetical protein
MLINNKHQSIKLFSDGCFGNRLRYWDSIEELKKNPPLENIVVMRYRGDWGGGFCKYDVPLNEVESVIKEWESKGADKNKIFFNETADQSKLLIQGELMEISGQLYFLYSQLKEKMRIALRKDPNHAIGLKVKMLLKGFLTPSSYDDLFTLLDTYPNHVIEFSTWSVCVGDNQNRNTIIWEIRNY